MATALQPLAPWMRDLSRFMNTPGAASPFLPHADVLVLTLRLPQPAQPQPRPIGDFAPAPTAPSGAAA
jgi:hypothetical protein